MNIKLNPNDVSNIQTLYSTTTLTLKEISALYNVSTSIIHYHVKNIYSENKLRGVGAVGKNCYLTKLTETSVKKILISRMKGGCSQKEIANRYNVDQSTVSRILRGKTWKHLFQGVKKKYKKEILNLK